MSYVGPLGIPHSEFLRWKESDQDKALAWHQREQQRCSRCGTHPEDWNTVRFPYTPMMDVCRGCEHMDWMKDDPEYGKAGRHVVMKPTDSLLRAYGVKS